MISIHAGYSTDLSDTYEKVNKGNDTLITPQELQDLSE